MGSPDYSLLPRYSLENLPVDRKSVKPEKRLLSPCPFCGTRADLRQTVHNLKDFDVSYRIECRNSDCGAMILGHKSPEKAYQAWERRVSDES